ncbi:MAG: Abi family protein [Fusobacteria bacterium]|nr:Abi family protein [Fusobacteriota bacterium]
MVNDIKLPTTYTQQIDILISRNIIINDKSFAIEILKNINYYRMIGYMLTYKSNDKYENITIENIYKLYNFDKKLRNLIFSLVENIEISFRAQISYFFSNKYGALGYLESNNFKNKKYHQDMVKKINTLTDRSREKFIEHHKDKYNNRYPMWVIVELMSFGDLSKLFNNLLDEDKNQLSKEYYLIKGEYISSWLHSICNIRNICAHHGRLYNRELKISPQLFKNDKKIGIDNRTLFGNIYVIKKLLKNNVEWKDFVKKLEDIINNNDIIDIKYLGFLENWKELLNNEEIKIKRNIEKSNEGFDSNEDEIEN